MRLLMVVFELRISCAAIDHAADFAATAAMLDTDFFLIWAYPGLFSGLFIAELFTTSITTNG